jgi:hypothetical protein
MIFTTVFMVISTVFIVISAVFMVIFTFETGLNAWDLMNYLLQPDASTRVVIFGIYALISKGKWTCW